LFRQMRLVKLLPESFMCYSKNV